MIELLEAAAAEAPHRTAVVSTEGTASYGELLEQSRRVATALRQRGIARLAVVEPDAAWVVRLLAGAALAGAEPCQYQPDTDPSEIAAQTAALGHTVVVTRREDLARRRRACCDPRFSPQRSRTLRRRADPSRC